MASTLQMFDVSDLRGPAVQTAIDVLAEAEAEARGPIFTRPLAVEFMLDLVGYTADRDLTQVRLLEPPFAAGDFLLVAVARLLASY